MCIATALTKLARATAAVCEANLSAFAVPLGAIPGQMLITTANEAPSVRISKALLVLEKRVISRISGWRRLSMLFDRELQVRILAWSMLAKAVKAWVPWFAMAATEGFRSALKSVHDPIAIAALLPIIMRLPVRIPEVAITTLIRVVRHALVHDYATIFALP